MVSSYGAPEEEYAAARHSAALLDRSARQLLKLTGPDRVSFLHGMVTNDIKSLPDNAACDAAFLTVKGAMVAYGRVVKLADSLLVDVEPGLLEKVREFLDRYLISEEVELTDVSAEYGQLALYGPRATALGAAALALPASPLAQNAMSSTSLDGATIRAVGETRYSGEGLDLLVPRAELERVFTSLVKQGARPIGHATFEKLRVEAGVPRYGQDLVDTTIPLEAELTSAISYDKGCYIGQEVIARATFRGHMNRKLSGLLLGELTPSPGTELRVGERKVGWITSVIASPAHGQTIALGYVHRDHREPGTVLQLPENAGTATVHALPFVAPGVKSAAP